MPSFHIASHRRGTLQLKSLGTLTAADDKDFVTVPWMRATLVGLVMSVRVGGTTSSSTGITLEMHRDEATAVDMLTAAVTIAHDATSTSTTSDSSNIAAGEVLQGDQIGLNIDTVPTAASDLSVILIFHINQE